MILGVKQVRSPTRSNYVALSLPGTLISRSTLHLHQLRDTATLNAGELQVAECRSRFSGLIGLDDMPYRVLFKTMPLEKEVDL